MARPFHLHSLRSLLLQLQDMVLAMALTYVLLCEPLPESFRVLTVGSSRRKGLLLPHHLS